MGVSVYAANGYTVEGQSYELTDGSSFDVNGNSSKNTLCYGRRALGSLEASGSINEQGTYGSWNAIGAYGEIALTYSYDGSYQTSNKEQWNLTTSNDKSVNGIDLGKKIEKGAIIVEKSSDGKQWETVSVQTNVFHKADSDIPSFYTISDADARVGTWFRVTLETQEINYAQVDVETSLYFAQEAVEAYLLSFQEETFCGCSVDTLITATQELAPMSRRSIRH